MRRREIVFYFSNLFLLFAVFWAYVEQYWSCEIGVDAAKLAADYTVMARELLDMNKKKKGKETYLKYACV